MSELKTQIIADMKSALKSQDKPRLKAVRMIVAAIRQKEIDERIDLTDAQVLTVIQKMVKQRGDSITQFQAAKRDDLVAIEEAELTVLKTYMPAQLSEAEVQIHITAAIKETNATSIKDIGKLMTFLKPKLNGKADMSLVSTLIKSTLT